MFVISEGRCHSRWFAEKSKSSPTRGSADFVFERRIYIPIIKPKENLPNRGIENQLRQIDRIVNPPIVRTDEWVEVIADYKGYAGKMEMFRIRVFEALYNKKVTIVKG